MLKRILDIFISIFALLIFSPILLLISLMILKKIGRPIFFTQLRPGLGGVVFKMTKFRTMNNNVDENGNLLINILRTSSLGHFLRNSSLDEIPELWNVLKGDMSLVGPRPLKVEYLKLYNEHQSKRHNIKPGITGFAQVNGRNQVSWEERFDMDVWYVENQSLWLDIKILFKTVYKVLNKEGTEHATDEVTGRFSGNKDE